MAATAVYVAPPLDRRKERFRWQNTEIIRAGDSFSLALLNGFVERVKEVEK